MAKARRRLPQLNIVIVAGNHDSAGRLEAPAPILDAFGITVVGQTKRLPDGSFDIDSLVTPLKYPDGSVGAWCMAVPFLRPGDVPRVPDTEDAYAAGIARLYDETLTHAISCRVAGQAIVAMGHCHLVGGKISEDSERRIIIGGAEAMSADIFGPEIAYVALGHLHLAQSVGQTHRRYSGSPLPMSFAEVGYPHQVVMVDLEGETVSEIRELKIPRTVELLRVPDQPMAINEVLDVLQQLKLPDLPESSWPYLEVRVRLDSPEPGLRARIDAALEGKPVRLARIDARQVTNGSTDAVTPVTLEALERLEPMDVFAKVYRDRYGAETPAPLLTALTELMLDIEGAAP
jgi:exonuclease SbcD